MAESHYVMLAPIILKPDVDEKSLLAASDRFEKGFVATQPGIVRRQLLRAKDGSYADLVFFESKAAADKVVEAEQSSPHCADYFGIMEVPDQSVPDFGVLSFELVKTYE